MAYQSEPSVACERHRAAGTVVCDHQRLSLRSVLLEARMGEAGKLFSGARLGCAGLVGLGFVALIVLVVKEWRKHAGRAVQAEATSESP